MPDSITDAPTGDLAERVLEDTWRDRERRSGDRERWVHSVFAGAVLAAALVLAVLAPPGREAPVLVALGLVAVYAWAARVEIAIGAGFAVPTQLVLVPMLLVLPPQEVPLLVAAGLVAATALEPERAGAPRLRRMVVAIGDAAYALAPAVVLVAFGSPSLHPDAAPVLLLAALAQCAGDFVSSSLREALTRGVRPSLQLAVMLQVWSIDALLWPVGVVLAGGIRDEPVVVLAIPPLIVLLQRLVRDRNRRLAQAQERLVALRNERERLRHAVRRIGDAFASGTELDSVLRTTLHAIVDAVGADGARVTVSTWQQQVGVVEQGDAEVHDIDVSVTSMEGTTAHLQLARAAGPLDEEERDLCRHLLDRALVSVEHLRRQAEIYEEAQTDELTGLPNRRRLQRALEAALEDLEDGGRPVTLVLLDLDDFKQVNDTWGHLAGDLVLRTAAFCLRDNIRRADLPARHGGEEFAVLMRVEAQVATRLAERVATALRTTRVSVGANQSVAVTASFGVATAGVHGRDARALLAAADAAMYRAKRAGKDRVELAPPPAAAAAAG